MVLGLYLPTLYVSRAGDPCRDPSETTESRSENVLPSFLISYPEERE